MSAVHFSIPALDMWRRGMKLVPDVAQQLLLAALTQATLLLERETKENMPRGATGLTAQSIHSDAFSTPAGALGVVGSAMPSALFVETGARPHWIGKDNRKQALEPWVREVLGVRDPKQAAGIAFAIAKKIAKKGTPAQKPFERAFASCEAEVVRIFERAAGALMQHMEPPTGVQG